MTDEDYQVAPSTLDTEWTSCGFHQAIEYAKMLAVNPPSTTHIPQHHVALVKERFLVLEGWVIDLSNLDKCILSNEWESELRLKAVWVDSKDYQKTLYKNGKRVHVI